MWTGVAALASEPADTRSVTLIVTLGAVGTIVTILVGLIAIQRAFRSWVEDRAKQAAQSVQSEAAHIKREIATTNGHKLGEMVECIAADLKELKDTAKHNREISTTALGLSREALAVGQEALAIGREARAAASSTSDKLTKHLFEHEMR